MDFMGLIKFALLCIDSLAWPVAVCALGYPLCASIRAIETGSKHHLRKVVMYWTLFSLISLFELASVKIIHRIPYWPTVKLITTLWLVMPRFNCACHAYQCLIHPLFKPKEEKELITCKCKEPDAAQKNGEILAVIQKSAKGVKEMTPKQDWICTLCNVKTSSETTLNAHLQGKKHKSNLQALKTGIQHIRESQQKSNGQQKQQDRVAVQPFKLLCHVCNIKVNSEIDLSNHIKGKRHMSNFKKMVFEELEMNGKNVNKSESVDTEASYKM